ncbi:MAG TPA: DinB family protein [Terracidiphilus sp.]|nr:DinB family protein [Terracidiphilus sp.]
MTPDLDETIALLTRTPAALNALLRDQPNIFLLRNEGGDTMSAHDVLAHLIDAERTNWIPRARILLEHGEAQAFPSFDRFAYIRASQDTPTNLLLDEFVEARSQSLDALRAMILSPGDLARRGLHPALGPVTLSQLLSAWTAHDLTHIHQISRILAHQYREAVGPFVRFIGVLQCNAHGA